MPESSAPTALVESFVDNAGDVGKDRFRELLRFDHLDDLVFVDATQLAEIDDRFCGSVFFGEREDISKARDWKSVAADRNRERDALPCERDIRDELVGHAARG